MKLRITPADPRAPLGAQLLLAFVCLAILAAILYPACVQPTRSVYRFSALSYAKQIGVSTMIYVNDFDDRWPLAAPGGKPTALGWAGRVAPYTKNKDIFRVPDDTEAKENADGLPIDFAFNANAARSPLSTAIEKPAHTILIFEAANAHAELGLADARCEPPRLSPVGDGTPGGLRDSLLPNADPHVRYALGLLGPAWDIGHRSKRSYGVIVFADSVVKAASAKDLARVGRDWTF